MLTLCFCSIYYYFFFDWNLYFFSRWSLLHNMYVYMHLICANCFPNNISQVLACVPSNQSDVITLCKLCIYMNEIRDTCTCIRCICTYNNTSISVSIPQTLGAVCPCLCIGAFYSSIIDGVKCPMSQWILSLVITSVVPCFSFVVS